MVVIWSKVVIRFKGICRREVGRSGGDRRSGVEGRSPRIFFFVATKAPAVRCGRCSAPSGSLLGGNSNAFVGGVERETNIVK